MYLSLGPLKLTTYGPIVFIVYYVQQYYVKMNLNKAIRYYYYSKYFLMGFKGIFHIWA